MRPFSYLILILTILSGCLYAQDSDTCKQCHPHIYQEYRSSVHASSSIFTDPIHRAVWEKHPAKNKGIYACAKCHTPADTELLKTKGVPQANETQRGEPISCRSCHTISHIEKGTRSNTNIRTDEPNYFYAVNLQRKGEKIRFRKEKTLFGLMTKTTGSPYHDIDYGNENFYNGKMCLGCHAYKKNALGFAVCDMQIKRAADSKNCIECHMPQIKGDVANSKRSGTHAFHGASIHRKPTELSRFVSLSLKTETGGFSILIDNQATHTLFPQPLRLSQLRVSIERDGHEIILDPVSFKRVIGTNRKPSAPWLATEVIADNTIKALEKRSVPFRFALQKGDVVVVRFGYYIVDPETAKKLGLEKTETSRFIVLTQKRFRI